MIVISGRMRNGEKKRTKRNANGHAMQAETNIYVRVKTTHRYNNLFMHNLSCNVNQKLAVERRNPDRIPIKLALVEVWLRELYSQACDWFLDFIIKFHRISS